MVGERVSRVHCNTCGAQHAWRASQPGTTTRASASRASASGPRTARIMNGNQVIAPTAAASTAITASRCSGPTLRCTTAATIAMIVTVNAV